MSKYIRTKDGKIFSVLVSDQLSKDEVAMDIIGFRIQTALKQNKCIANKDNILKVANTIEELVDVYILKDTETSYCGVMSKETMKHSINPGTAYGREFYGAIWGIDKKGIPTLKPIAKMNKEGELELL